MGGRRLRGLAVVLAALGCAACEKPQEARPAPPTASAPPPIRKTLFGPDQAKAWGATLGDGFSADSSAGILVQGERNIYAVSDGRPLAREPFAGPFHFSVAPDGTLHVVVGDRYGTLVDGRFEERTRLPSVGFRLASAPGRTYLFGPLLEGAHGVLVIEKSTVRELLRLEQPVDALLPWGPDFLFAQGGRLYRAGLTEQDRLSIVPGLVLEERRILSLACDEARELLFVATADQVFAVIEDRVAPILDVGGRIALGGSAKGHLYVYQPERFRAEDVALARLAAGKKEAAR